MAAFAVDFARAVAVFAVVAFAVLALEVVDLVVPDCDLVAFDCVGLDFVVLVWVVVAFTVAAFSPDFVAPAFVPEALARVLTDRADLPAVGVAFAFFFVIGTSSRIGTREPDTRLRNAAPRVGWFRLSANGSSRRGSGGGSRRSLRSLHSGAGGLVCRSLSRGSWPLWHRPGFRHGTPIQIRAT